MLGPIAIDPSVQSLGLGGKLMREALQRARSLGHRAVLLVGDAPYYERFGFSTEKTGSLWLPGPYERNRFLARELEAGALDNARGLVSATGALRAEARSRRARRRCRAGCIGGPSLGSLKPSTLPRAASARPSDWAARR